ncbi:MAG: transposon-encoded TnpW family protein [Oscillospiraceae bacterium]|jgi:hypothetical protein|nr:transposon-encoded TnpW family protein [Oscillospiraceae bacterium]
MTKLNANTPTVQTAQSNISFTKRIKSTVYEVNVYFSQTSKETINDKIIRLLKREVAS